MGEHTPEAAAPALDIVPNTLRNWLAGTSLPPMSKVPALARKLGMRIEVVRAAVKADRAARSARRSARLHHARPARKG